MLQNVPAELHPYISIIRRIYPSGMGEEQLHDRIGSLEASVQLVQAQLNEVQARLNEPQVQLKELQEGIQALRARLEAVVAILTSQSSF